MDCLITPADRIFVAGHRGMAGSAICRALQRMGYSQILTASRTELDLLDGAAVERWFAANKPTVVVLAAAKVGGIQANSSYPADFLLDNLKIQTHVIETAWRAGVSRLAAPVPPGAGAAAGAPLTRDLLNDARGCSPTNPHPPAAAAEPALCCSH